MIFALQRYLEDHFDKRGFDDPDQYAVRLANSFGQLRWETSREAFEKAMHRIQTVFFRRNSIADRRDFEVKLLDVLERKFPKKKSASLPAHFPGGVESEKRRLNKRQRLSVRGALELFKHATESRAVDSFWKSRRKGKLINQPEKKGQNLLAVFLQGLLHSRSGFSVNEVASGVGWIDVLLVLASTPHLLELKILRDSDIPGVNQLGTYMKQEKRDEGWLVLFDTRNPSDRDSIPETISTKQGTVRTIVIDVNPIPPSRR